ncbi:MAG: 2OG-Fe dioxygenase family protein [Novosphingobium sp.]
MVHEQILGLGATITRQGWAALAGEQVRALVGPAAEAGWDAFRKSWSALGPDRYMADGGRYRRRRHAVLALAGGEVRTLPPRPHYQSRDYNPLNGGIERWFAPVQPEVLDSKILHALLGLCRDVFSLADITCEVEVHQFRIEADEVAGHPTPEGMHRDGVDRVAVFLIERSNVVAGTTRIAIDGEKAIAEFTLIDPLDAVFIDDRRVRHGVTPITRLIPGCEAHRDVLVLTFRYA